MNGHRLFRSIIPLFLALAVSGIVLAQDFFFDPTLPGRWETTKLYDGEKDYELTQEDSAGCRLKIEQMVEILKNTPPLNEPKGFLAQAAVGYEPPCDWHLQYRPPYKTQRVRMQITLMLPGLFRIRGKAVPQMEPPYLRVDFNDLLPFARQYSLNYEGVWDEQGRFIITEPRPTETRQGIPVYEGGSFLFARGSKPLWTPVTQEQYLKAMIKFYREKKRLNPDETSNDIMIEYLQGEWEVMTPAERKKAAHYFGGGENPSGLTPSDDENGAPLVALNPDYYDPKLPRTSVQLIVIRLYYEAQHPRKGMTFPTDGTNLTLAEFEKNLNYKAVSALLDR